MQETNVIFILLRLCVFVCVCVYVLVHVRESETHRHTERIKAVAMCTKCRHQKQNLKHIQIHLSPSSVSLASPSRFLITGRTDDSSLIANPCWPCQEFWLSAIDSLRCVLGHVWEAASMRWVHVEDTQFKAEVEKMRRAVTSQCVIRSDRRKKKCWGGALRKLLSDWPFHLGQVSVTDCSCLYCLVFYYVYSVNACKKLTFWPGNICLEFDDIINTS